MKLPMAVAFCLIGIALSAQSPPDDLVSTRQEFSAAAAKGDKASYAKFLTDDFTWTNRAGRLRNKEQVLAELRAATSANPTPPAAPDIRSYGTSAIVLGINRNPDGAEVRVMQAWVRTGKQWQMVADHRAPIGDKPVPPAGNSSSVPASVGSAADLQAIAEAITALNQANRKGDVNTFAASVTDQFVAIGTTGNILSKSDRMKAIAAGSGAPPNPAPTAETSTRIHGDLAVTTNFNRSQAGTQSRQTIVHVKQQGRWLRAAIITTQVVESKAP